MHLWLAGEVSGKSVGGYVGGADEIGVGKVGGWKDWRMKMVGGWLGGQCIDRSREMVRWVGD